MRKRIVGILLAFVLLIPLCLAGEGKEVGLQLIYAKIPRNGENFTVKAELATNEAVGVIDFSLSYDEDVVAFESYQLGEILNGALTVVNPTEKEIRLAAISAQAIQESGMVCEFTFRLKDETKTVSIDLESATLADTDGNTVWQLEGTGMFVDVPATHWAYETVNRAAKLGLVSGVGNGLFSPDRAMTRAEFTTVLYRMAGSPESSITTRFDDVAPDDWFASAVSWAAENGYVNGDGSHFHPNGMITRQDVATILFRMAGETSGAETMLTSAYDNLFSDSGDISAYAKKAVYWAVYNGIVNGTTENTVSPKHSATRAQIATLILRYIDHSDTTGGKI